MPSQRITKAFLKTIKPDGSTSFFWDDEVPGFGVKLYPGGRTSFVCQYRDDKGASKRVTLGNTEVVNLDRARERAREIVATVQLRQDPFPKAKSGPPLNDVASEFLASTKAKAAPRTAKDYEAVFNQHIGPEFGKKPILQIGRGEIEKWHEGLGSTPRRANYALTVLVAIFSFAVRRKIIEPNDHPARGIEKFEENKRSRYLSITELERFGSCLTQLEAESNVSPWAAAALRLLILTGARSSEILTLEWDFIDFERRLLHLPSSKTGKKDIVVSADALSILRLVPKIEGVKYVIAGRKHGERMVSLQRPFGLICEKAEIKGLRIHDLRHSAASFATSAGVGLPVIGKVLGQSQAYTQQRYSHIHDSAERAAVEVIASKVAPFILPKPVEIKKGRRRNG